MAVLATVITLCLITATLSGASGPMPAHNGLGADGQMRLSASDRCPVCAMFPARQPASAAAMRLKNGSTFYFCSNGCLLRAFLRPVVYLNARPSDIDRLTVLDYFSGKPTDGRKATWVAGSDVVGPMGPAIIALSDAGQLAAFQRRHGGGTVFSLDHLNDDLWKRISHHDLPPADR
ncbi:MAG: nitrous oxide reductase accessory protein NosL [Desulfovibrionaceae bacterium]